MKLYETYCTGYYQDMRITPNFWEEFKSILCHLDGCKTILDIGAGTGRATSLLKALGFKAVGIDTSPIALKLAKEHNQLVIHGDAYHTGFPDNMFDAVISLHVLEHLTNPERAIKESVRVSRKTALHVVPLGKRDDPTHIHVFKSVYDLANERFDRKLNTIERCRTDGKWYGILEFGIWL
jgi:ubiquinone/menaquinone biosynthesis C-methylase UbiE